MFILSFFPQSILSLFLIRFLYFQKHLCVRSFFFYEYEALYMLLVSLAKWMSRILNLVLKED